MNRRTELPVFYDRNGRRWRRVKICLAIIFCGAIIFSLHTIPEVFRETPVAQASPTNPAVTAPSKSKILSPSGLTDKIDGTNIPVIGQGPFAQVVRVTQGAHGYATTPIYSNRGADIIPAADAQRVGSHEYAIQRYGHINSKQLVLTFDDGPDPTWTPKILDQLSANHAQATFFEIGSQIVKYPAITNRVVREGHMVGNHTFNHVNFNMMAESRASQEINQTQRVIRAASGHSTSFLRLPYGGNDDQSLRDFTRGILEAQKQGYVATYFDFDSNDWDFAKGVKPVLPSFDGSGLVVLLHDGGGDRSRTLPYLTSLIKSARAYGYTFVTLNTAYSQGQKLFAPTQVSLADKTTFYATSAYLVWPHTLVSNLFFLTAAAIVLGLVTNVVLAYISIRKTSYKRRKNHYLPLVSVVVPAYNEEAVLAKAVLALLRSRYRHLEVIIVNDGSEDKTASVASSLARNPRVQAYHKNNAGKASALNLGINKACGEVVVGIDADTVLARQTIGKLVRHFSDPRVGAVASAVKVGNLRNTLTRWQLIDYTIGIYIERNAQALLNAIMIVPGACGAWRKEAILASQGYSSTTLAEDFDLTLAIHCAGYKVLQDNEAIAYTEAPLSIRSLFKQRYRWIFGDIQNFWKYRRLLLRWRYRWLGIYALPMTIYNVVMPLAFGGLLLVIEVQNVLAGNYKVVLLFLAFTMVLQFITTAIALSFAHERLRYLLMVPLTRLVYGPMRSFILYRAFLHALKGTNESWSKLPRTGTVRYGYVPRAASVRWPDR